LGLPVPAAVQHFQQFIDLHASQLEAIQLPRSLWRQLYAKLHEQLFDAGAVFGLRQNVSTEDDAPDLAAAAPVSSISSAITSSSSAPASASPSGRHRPFDAVVASEQSIPEAQEVWLIDHAWTTRPDLAVTQLKDHPALLTRMATIMDVPLYHYPDEWQPDLRAMIDLLFQHFDARIPKLLLLQVYEREDEDLVSAVLACEAQLPALLEVLDRR
jgi:hypothetical protein